jgi:precorrin-3B synthase
VRYPNGCARYAYRERMTRTRGRDACPGALQVHRAADGALARIRLPGGMIDPAQLEALAHAATRFGSPAMELTSRGNIQIRGIRGEKATLAVADAVAAAGLLPSPTHERVRNIVASPLSGRVGGHPDVRDWVHRLDAAIRAEPALAALPGRFWFGIDDGRGDVSVSLQTSVRTCLTNRSPYVGRPCSVRNRTRVVTTLVSIASASPTFGKMAGG